MLFTVGVNETGKCLIASSEIPAGTVVGTSETAQILDRPTMYTYQFSEHVHLDLQDDLRLLAHSCEPNCYLDWSAGNPAIQFRTLHAVHKGEVLFFNYNDSEWDMNSPFDCLCGSNNCFGRISGFKHLTAHQRSQVLPRASPFILQRYQAMNLSASTAMSYPLASQFTSAVAQTTNA